jgi:hypothetical protein
LYALLREFTSCFTWNYTEMPGLSQDLVEHKLRIKLGFRPFKQSVRRYNTDLLGRIKEEVERLIQANFIQMSEYVEWVSNIVPVENKNTGKLKNCMDFRNLNIATPKDEYPMPMAEALINRASGHKMISFLDGNTGYNQIFMAEEDVQKIVFRCPGFVGLFEWVVMTSGLKNAGATYQRAMNLIFHDLLGVLLEVYIDNLVVKSAGFKGHMADLRIVFERMKSYNLKMNPMKCASSISAGRFLGFIIHEKGIEFDLKKVESIKKLEEPKCKQDVHKLLGKVNYLRRFITNMAGKVKSFLALIQLKHESDFVWGDEQRNVFEKIKVYLSTPPVLQAPQVGVGFRLYIATQEWVVGTVLT